MQATSILKEEHGGLRQVLSCLESVADEVRRRGRLDELAAGRILDYLRRFADGSHQAKEEDLLRRAAPGAVDAGAAAELARCACSHDDERRLLAAMGVELELALAGDSFGLDRFVNRARDYVRLQRRHAEREERELFPLLERLLADADEAELLAGFERIDRDFGLRGERAPGRASEWLRRRCGLAPGGERPVGTRSARA